MLATRRTCLLALPLLIGPTAGLPSHAQTPKAHPDHAFVVYRLEDFARNLLRAEASSQYPDGRALQDLLARQKLLADDMRRHMELNRFGQELTDLLDLYLEEGRDAGSISDEVAERVRKMFRDEYDTEPAGGFEVDVHQPRKFFQGTSEPA